MHDPVYLDFNATTPVAEEVLEPMLPFLRQHHGNPSSAHVFGQRAAQAVMQARAQVAALIGAGAEEIVFTGGATEANNLALPGAAQAAAPERRHLVITAVEHPAVMAPAQRLQARGWALTMVPVDGHGRVSVEAVAEALRADTAIVSVMHANNEVGTLQPVAEIAALTRPRGILLHTDAAQSAGKVALDVDALGVDLLQAAGETVAASVGSACHSEHDAVSGVLAAMGLSAPRAAGAVRLSVGRPSTEDDVRRAADALTDAWRRLAAG
jgi:cysteine desulfurase